MNKMTRSQKHTTEKPLRPYQFAYNVFEFNYTQSSIIFETIVICLALETNIIQ